MLYDLSRVLRSLHRWHWVDHMAKIINVYHAQLYHPFPMSSPPLQIAISSFHSLHWSIIQLTLIIWVDLHWILVLVWCSPVIINKDNTTLSHNFKFETKLSLLIMNLELEAVLILLNLVFAFARWKQHNFLISFMQHKFQWGWWHAKHGCSPVPAVTYMYLLIYLYCKSSN